ncbi:MAG TPA: hypothetical protein VHR41_17055 [Gemmatimonadales bacterium]|jgi:hypothetical protein|nr:hypothetical protein [Gemmatimonadales bacterium]
MRPVFASLVLAAAGIGLVPNQLLPQAVPASASLSPSLEQVRAALDKYQDPILAVHDGYFSTLACIQFPSAGGAGQVAYPAGGMGVHFLNVGLIGAPLDPLHPQVLLYEQHGDKLRLAAAEWFVPLPTGAKGPPRLFDRTFDGPMEGHHPIMPAMMHHYDLHVWLWKANPAGMFSPTNPAIKCSQPGYSLSEKAPRLVPAQ